MEDKQEKRIVYLNDPKTGIGMSVEVDESLQTRMNELMKANPQMSSWEAFDRATLLNTAKK